MSELNTHNNYPDGKILPNDEGETRAAIFIHDNRIVIDFGKPVAWLGFDKPSFRKFIDTLEEKFKELK